MDTMKDPRPTRRLDFKRLDTARAQLAVSVQGAKDLVSAWVENDEEEELPPVKILSSTSAGLGAATETKQIRSRALEKLQKAKIARAARAAKLAKEVKNRPKRADTESASESESESESRTARTRAVRKQAFKYVKGRKHN